MYRMYKQQPFLHIEPLSQSDFKRWAELLERRLGIVIPSERKLFLQSKIWSRMRDLGYAEYQQYWDFVNSGVEGNVEWSRLLDRLTVHETSFFRHRESFDLVAADLTAKIKRKDGLKYKIWSAACATGEEAYSLSMVAHDLCVDNNASYGITATDVSGPAVAIANQAIYRTEKLSTFNKQEQKHIKRLSEDMFTINDNIKKRVAFGVFNLLNINRPNRMTYDVIFCQNVLIYFEQVMKRQILDGMVDYLAPGGLLVLGQTEINAWTHHRMERVRRSGTLAFRLK